MVHFAKTTGLRSWSMTILSALALGTTLLAQPALAASPDAANDATTVTPALTLSRPALSCVNDKLRAALKEFADVGACLRHALATNTDPDLSCINIAVRQLGATFAKLEAKGGCDVTGEATDVERLVRDLTLQVAQTVVTNACQPSGAPCPGIFVPCCAGQGCIADLGADAVCR